MRGTNTRKISENGERKKGFARIFLYLMDRNIYFLFFLLFLMQIHWWMKNITFWVGVCIERE